MLFFIGLKPRIDNDIEFQFVYDPHHNNNFEPVPHHLVIAKAVLLPKPLVKGEAAEFDDMDLEEYEFDILWDEKKELWVTTIKNGSYLINAKIKGYKEINEYVEISGHEQDYKFNCIPANS